MPGADRERVGDDQPPGARHPGRLDDVRPGEVAAARRHRDVDRREAKAAGVAVEHLAPEHARPVDARQAQPLDVAVRTDEGADLAIGEEAVLGDRWEVALADGDIADERPQGATPPRRSVAALPRSSRFSHGMGPSSPLPERATQAKPKHSIFESWQVECRGAAVLGPEATAVLDPARVVDELEHGGLDAVEDHGAGRSRAEFRILVAEQGRTRAISSPVTASQVPVPWMPWVWRQSRRTRRSRTRPAGSPRDSVRFASSDGSRRYSRGPSLT